MTHLMAALARGNLLAQHDDTTSSGPAAEVNGERKAKAKSLNDKYPPVAPPEVPPVEPVLTAAHVLPEIPDLDLAGLAMESNVDAMTEATVLSVMLGWPERQYFQTRAGWVLGTPTKPYYAIKMDKAGGGMTRRRAREKWRIVPPSVVPLLHPSDYQRVILYACVTIASPGMLPGLYLAPVRVDGWATSARSGFAQAQAGWIRLIASDNDAYHIQPGQSKTPPLAMWPAGLDFDTFAKLGLKDRVITDENHPVVRGLLGRW